MSGPPPESWVGRSERTRARLEPWPAAALSAAFGRGDPPREGEPLPPFWHHLYALPIVHAAGTGSDGHAERGGFLPPVARARRMWAGGRVRLPGDLPVGATITRVSTVTRVEEKDGRSGPFTLVTVRHEIDADGALAVVEEQDLVYTDGPPAGAGDASRHARDGRWEQRWRPDEVLLFRYSALTYNGHRIHYDHAYATRVEGYAGVVVHGPLLATLMLDLVRRRRPDARVRSFDYRARAAAICGQPVVVRATPEGASVRLAALDGDDRPLMTGSAELA